MANNSPGKKPEANLAGKKQPENKVDKNDKRKKASHPSKRGDSPGIKERWQKLKDYLTSVYNEMKKVHWPDRKALTAYTAVVLVSVLVVSLLIWIFDSLLSYLLEMLFKAFA